MRIHHFYPRTSNLGDRFVALGIERLFRSLVPEAVSVSFDVNDRGSDPEAYGITLRTVERANREADLVVVGGSNLYEAVPGRNRWGVHLDPSALPRLRVPMLLVGIGTGSDPGARRPTPPTPQVAEEIRLLNRYAVFSGVRDVVTLEWLQALGVSTAQLLGDPATFLFCLPVREPRQVRRVALVPPPRRPYWERWRRIRFWDMRGPNLWRAMADLVRELVASGLEVWVMCNDPRDVSLVRDLFAYGRLAIELASSAESYLALLQEMDAVVTARLHTAVVALSLGIPFVLVDLDQRTHGFVRTFGLGEWTVPYAWAGMTSHLRRRVLHLVSGKTDWRPFVAKRDEMRDRALAMLRGAIAVGPAAEPPAVRIR
ncbi:MAG: polysaccharide pyruvyl transferase family protein [Armatimonadetes bacterium]|nr:polysaccharide pyruvyl transferase family protein [Armatimonadota bacterium]MDW8153885.1 polysaccharide pyruvyl transferase family protein [Armatimonadota bacterium]